MTLAVWGDFKHKHTQFQKYTMFWKFLSLTPFNIKWTLQALLYPAGWTILLVLIS